MGMYHEGYQAAVNRALALDEAGLYRILDDLYGRDDLPEDPTVEDVRAEALRQLADEFRDDSDRRWSTVDLFVAIHRAGGLPGAADPRRRH